MKKGSKRKAKKRQVKKKEEEHSENSKSCLNFITFWPLIDKEFFKDFSAKNIQHLNQMIHYLSVPTSNNYF